MTTVTDEAPGTLEIVRLFENTLNLPDGPDQLDTVDRAAAWCRRYGLPVVGDETDLVQLREFREALRDVLYANQWRRHRTCRVGRACASTPAPPA